MRRFPIGRGALSRPALPLALASVLLAGSGAGAAEPFSEADIFFELNATDGDVGVHVALDGESWKQLRIEDPRRREIIEVEPEGSAAKVGLTELFFEGEEPSLLEVPFRRFLQLFPPGSYLFHGKTVGNQLLRSRDRLSAELPCPVEVLSPTDAQPVATDAVVIRWQTVPGVYDPDTRICDQGRDVELVGYQVVAEAVNDAAGFSRSFVVDLPADATEVRVPAEFIAAGAALTGTEFKLEILGIENTGNKTIVEQGFLVESP